MVRRLLLAVVLCALAGAFGAARADAAPMRPLTSYSMTSAHFVLHYDFTDREAADLLADAERAYTAVIGLGFVAPPDDGDGHIDLYVADLSATPGVLGAAIPDNNVAGTSGSIDIDGGTVGSSDEFATLAHELFHLIQFRYWMPLSNQDAWLLEAQAEWVGFKADGYSGIDGTTGPSDISLDCFGVRCSSIQYESGGYSRWNFMEYLAQRFGVLFAKDVLVQAQSSGSPLGGLTAAIAAKGTTLSDVYQDFTTRWMTGGWGSAAIDKQTPDPYDSVLTGTATADLSTEYVAVNHLATRYLEFDRGDGAGDHPCFAATMTVTVTLPSGLGASRPVFFWNGAGSTAVPLSVTGSTATTTVPWDTCLWSDNFGYLSLPNPTTAVDAAIFAVSTHLTVDTTKPASATTPPAAQTGATVYGGVTSVDSAAVPPAITLLAPQTIKLTAASPNIKLVAESNGDGSLHATLGSVDLGTQAVRAGSNVLVFAVPASLLSALRRSAAAGNVLTLTPLSPSGAVAGAAMTRQVVIQAAPKPAAKPKAKTKAKAKAKAKSKPKK